MRALVVHAHPLPDSYSATLLDATCRGLEAGGHEVRVVRLYEEGFRPEMSATERLAYHEPTPVLDPQVQAHAEHVRWAEALVFVYPTWWAGLPAMLKGWLERVLVNGVAFHHVPTEGGHKVEPALQHVRRVVGITTYGSGRWYTFLLGDGGRRTLLRALWLNTPPLRCRRVWLGLYGIEGSTDEERQAFARKVEQRMAAL